MFSWLSKLAVVGAVGLLVGSVSLAQPIIIFSENPAPGDALIVSGSTLTGDQIGSTNWYYNWTRYGTVGIRNDQSYLTGGAIGNGAIYFDVGPGQTGQPAPQAGLSFFQAARISPGTQAYTFATSGSVIANFQQLDNVVYSWYRSSVSNTTNTGVNVARHPVLEINIDLDGNPAGGPSGFLRFIRPSGPAPLDQWVTDSIATGNVLRWFGASGLPTATQSLSDWKTYFQQNYPNAAIVGFTFIAYGEVGRTFQGALDNVSWTIGGQTTSYTFEVVPEPASLLTLGAGIAGLLAHRRLRRAS